MLAETRLDSACKTKETRRDGLALWATPASPTHPHVSTADMSHTSQDMSHAQGTLKYQLSLHQRLSKTCNKSEILFPNLLQTSITSSDCVLQRQLPKVIYNCQLLHRTASSKDSFQKLFITVNYFIGLRPRKTACVRGNWLLLTLLS